MNFSNGNLIFLEPSFTIFCRANVTLSSLQDVNIGGGYSGIDDYNWNGRIAITKIYNRELSTAEAQQNFNALRSRFGI